MTVTEADVWVCPTAREILPWDAPRARWLAERRKGLGGSDAAAVAGLSPWKSRYALYLDKTGQLPEQPDNDAMEWGRRLEDPIACWWSEYTGIEVRRAGLMAHVEHDWWRVTPDRLTADGGILEIKTTAGRNARHWDDEQVPDLAELQVAQTLGVTGRSHAHVAVLIDGRTPLVRRVERDQGLIDTLFGIEAEFWHDYVLAGREPALDGSTSTADALGERWPAHVDDKTVTLDAAVLELLDERDQAKADEKEAKARARAAENQLAARIGDAERVLVHGDDVCTYRATGAFSAAHFEKEHPELAAEYVTTTTTLDKARLKSEHPDLYRQHCARVLRRTTTDPR